MPIRYRRVAELAAAATGARAESESTEAARARWGSFAQTLARDVFVDAPGARSTGWAPRRASLEAAIGEDGAFLAPLPGPAARTASR